MARATQPRRSSSPSGPRKRNIVPDVGFLIVASPPGVPAGTDVYARGEPRLQTEVLDNLPTGRWNLVLDHAGQRWSARIDLDERPSTNPLRVTLLPEQALAGTKAVIRSTARPDAKAAGVDAAGDARTIVYVHGIGNKPPAETLRCQWDRALLDVPLGDRSRLAYWVDRTLYPTPEIASCNGADMSLPGAAGMAARAARLAAPSDPPDRLVEALEDDPRRQAVLRGIAARVEEAATAPLAEAPQQPSVRVLPGGKLTRRWLARWLTDLLLPDVHAYLFDPQARENMIDAVMDRLRGGGEPFVVVAHSLGSVIAYELLRRFRKEDCQVALFVTIGSPLGMQEIRDHLAEGGKLTTPECVARWVDFADPFDPVAVGSIEGNYKANTGRVAVERISIRNAERSTNPHSGTGYLRTVEVRTCVREVTGQAFASPLTRSSIAANVTTEADAGRGGTLHEVLIQLEDPAGTGAPAPLQDVATRLVAELHELTATRPSSIPRREEDEPEVLSRFVVAKLTRSEIESLRTRAEELRLRLVWANAKKRALIGQSAATVQALPGHLGYGATGRNIAWAVLDTGIDEEHQHFARYKNVRAQWDCMARGRPTELSGGRKADPNGHGTHVAAIIAGACRGKWDGREQLLTGMAPEATLFGYRVLGPDGVGSDSAIIKALDHIAQMNDAASGLVVHGVNLSLGSGYDPSIYGCGHTPLCQELRRLWRQGVVVCLAAGNEGYATFQTGDGEMALNLDLSIGDPANLDEAIAVGSVHKENPHTYGISYFSSRGPTADGRRKPDCVAPGERIVSARSGGRSGSDDLSKCYVEMSGTSMAAPHVSGVLAAFLSARREFVGYPDRAKRILLEHCTDLARDTNMQGAGLVNLTRMLLAI